MDSTHLHCAVLGLGPLRGVNARDPKPPGGFVVTYSRRSRISISTRRTRRGHRSTPTCQPQRCVSVSPVFQSGRRPGSPLTERAVNFIVKEAAERAGVDPAAAILCYATPPPNTDYFIKADAVLPPVIELSGEGGGLRCALWRAFSRVPPISR